MAHRPSRPAGSGLLSIGVEAGVGLTVLRLRRVNQNFSEDFLLDPVLTGERRLPAGDGQESSMDADDIAEVAGTALTDDRHSGQSYELTARLMSFTGIAEDLRGPPDAPSRTFQSAWTTSSRYTGHQGVPADWAQMLECIYAQLGSGALATTSKDAERSLANRPGLQGLRHCCRWNTK